MGQREERLNPAHLRLAQQKQIIHHKHLLEALSESSQH
jgi:hypothetical protein